MTLTTTNLSGLVLVAVALPGLLAAALRLLINPSAKWPRTEGLVTSATSRVYDSEGDVIERVGQSIAHYQMTVAYEYQFRGKVYEAEASFADALHLINRLTTGARVEVAVNPWRPSRSTWRRATRSRRGVFC